MFGGSNAPGEIVQGRLLGDIEYIYGGSGTDVLFGGSGHDFLSGDRGADYSFGGAGPDTLSDGSGNDIEVGGLLPDSISPLITAAAGARLTSLGLTASDLAELIREFEDVIGSDTDDDNDYLSGGPGNDFLYGGSGNDSLNAGSYVLSLGARFSRDDDVATNLLIGGAASDSLYGADGADILVGDGLEGQSIDAFLPASFPSAVDQALIRAIAGLAGGASADWLQGNGGNDTLIGGGGPDMLIGGGDADRFVFTPGSGADLINDFDVEAGDKLVITGGQTFTISDDGIGGTLLKLSGGGTVDLLGVGPDTVNGSFFSL
jgi:Ca2+-binding RTX toxin-like protein